MKLNLNKRKYVSLQKSIKSEDNDVIKTQYNMPCLETEDDTETSTVCSSLHKRRLLLKPVAIKTKSEDVKKTPQQLLDTMKEVTRKAKSERKVSSHTLFSGEIDYIFVTDKKKR